MMTIFSISIIILLFSNYISSDNIVLTRIAVDPSLTPNTCTNAKECPVSDACIVCDNGLGPDCEQPTCIDGKCGVIERCSQDILSTTMTTFYSNQCKGTDASHCIFDQLCALCLPGYSPDCAKAICINDECKIISPCSTYTPTVTSISTQSSTITEECQNDNQCPYPEYCAVECKEGSGPLCASAKCVDGKCQTIKSCSQKLECTEKDLSQCVVPQICARCKPGYTPPCAQASCQNGQCATISPCSISPPSDDPSTTSPTPQCKTDVECAYLKQCVKECKAGFGPLCAYSNCIKGKCVITTTCSQKIECTEKDLSQCIVPQVCAKCKEGYSPACAEATCENDKCKTIMPCTIYTEPTTSTPPNDLCTQDSECPRTKFCATKCPTGTTPRCESAKCVDGKCIAIKPCSQRTCKTQATCPYNKLNCAVCGKGYGPKCEQPACSCGVCSIVPPCSKKLNIAISSIFTERK